MHTAQKIFLKQQIDAFFSGEKSPRKARVIDIGSLDINGNNRDLLGFDRVDSYTGVDLMQGKNVDVVSHFADYNIPKSQAPHLIISGEALEHDSRWAQTITRAIDSLAEGGVAIFTAAGWGRPEHGTRQSTPNDSPATLDYYQNITMYHIYHALKSFKSDFTTEIVVEHKKDIYFVFKKQKPTPESISLKKWFIESLKLFFRLTVSETEYVASFIEEANPKKPTFTVVQNEKANVAGALCATSSFENYVLAFLEQSGAFFEMITKEYCANKNHCYVENYNFNRDFIQNYFKALGFSGKIDFYISDLLGYESR